MTILKDWMREVRQSIDVNNENDDSSGEEDNDVRMIEEFALPRQPTFWKASDLLQRRLRRDHCWHHR